MPPNLPAPLPDVTSLALPSGPCVVMLVGVTDAGKSALAEHLAAALPAAVVGYAQCHAELHGAPPRDAASRAAVALALDRLAERCRAGHSTVLNGTHLDAVHRRRVRAVAAAAGSLPVVALVVATPAAVYEQPPATPAHQVAAMIHTSRALPTEGYTAVRVLSLNPHPSPTTGTATTHPTA